MSALDEPHVHRPGRYIGLQEFAFGGAHHLYKCAECDVCITGPAPVVLVDEDLPKGNSKKESEQ
jgi:hypothetical protein